MDDFDAFANEVRQAIGSEWSHSPQGQLLQHNACVVMLLARATQCDRCLCNHLERKKPKADKLTEYLALFETDTKKFAGDHLHPALLTVLGAHKCTANVSAPLLALVST